MFESVLSSFSEYEKERDFSFSSTSSKDDDDFQVEVVIDGQISTRDLETGLKCNFERAGKRLSKRIVKAIDRVRSSNIAERSGNEIRKILDSHDVKYRIPREKICCTMYVTTTRSLDITIDVDLCVQLVQDRSSSSNGAIVKQEKNGRLNVSINMKEEKDEDDMDIFGTIWTRLTFSTTLLSSETSSSEEEEEEMEDDDEISWKLSISVTSSHHNRKTTKPSSDSTEVEKSTIRRRKRGVSGENDDDDLEPLLRKSDDEEDRLKTRALQMYRKENLAIPVIYFMLGMTIKLPLVALREYMRKVLEVDPDTQTMVLSVLATLPWHLKLIFAFLSDSIPIGGQRRRPYIYLGIVTCGSMWTLFGLLPTHPGLAFTSLLLFCATFGLVMIDVNVDAVVVERVSWEKGDDVGTLQGLVWRLRYGGAFVGMMFGGILLNFANFSEQQIFCLVGILHLCVQLPFITIMTETKNKCAPKNIGNQMTRIFEAISDSQIYQPLFFLLFSGLMPSSGDAFANFLLGPLHFSDFEYASIAAVSIVALMGGITIYDNFLKEVHIHKLFYVIIVVQSVLKLTQLLLVYRVNVDWGISDVWFAFGDEVINDTFNFMLQMPVLIFAARVCPKDVEGSVYAFLTMSMNVAGGAGNTVSSLITHGLGITLTNFDNLGHLILICSACNLIPMLLVHNLPKYISDVQAITRKSPKQKNVGLMVLMTVLFFLMWSLSSAFVNILSSHGGENVIPKPATYPNMHDERTHHHHYHHSND